MDVLRPALTYIGNRCYRKNNVQMHVGEKLDDLEQDDFTAVRDEYADESCMAGFEENIECTPKGYQLTFYMPSVFHKHIVGKKGEMKKRIESETRTQIKIPRQFEDGDVVISGSDKAGVRSARTRIDVLQTTARRRMPFTHFLSIPIGDECIRDKFEEFKTQVLQECRGDRGIDATIFQNCFKLHITLGILVLLDEDELQQAIDVLEKCRQELFQSVLKNEPMMVHIHGLEYMNDDPNAVDVLYAKVSLTDKSNRLQTFANRVVDEFVNAGIMNREYDRVKLHITVINSLMRKDPSGTTVTQTDRQKERESFDASNVLKLFRDYDFGDYRLDAVHISHRASASPDAYYSSAASIQLP